MTWTYQDTMPREIDKVRFYLGDTVSTAPLLTDEEIKFSLDEGGGPRSAAAICCDRLAAKFAVLVDTTVGTLRISYSNKAKQFHEMAVNLRARAAYQALPHAGGILVAEKSANQQDDSLVEPSFTVDQLDSTYVGKLNTTQGSVVDELDTP